jgi:hypothetical protein
VRRSSMFDDWIKIYQERYGIEKTALSQPELWDALPKIRPQDILQPGGIGHQPSSSARQPKARRLPNNAPTAAKAPLKRIREEESESELETPASKPRKTRPISREDKDSEPTRHKRRRLEKQRARKASETEEEVEEDTPRIPARPLDLGQSAVSSPARSQPEIYAEQPEANGDSSAVITQDAPKAEAFNEPAEAQINHSRPYVLWSSLPFAHRVR